MESAYVGSGGLWINENRAGRGWELSVFEEKVSTQPGSHIKAYQEALRLEPDFVKAWGGLAAAYANSGNRSAALEAVKELRRYDSKEAEELFNLIMKP